LTNAFLIKAKKRPKHEGGLLHDFTLHVFVSNYFAAVRINVKNNVPRNMGTCRHMCSWTR